MTVRASSLFTLGLAALLAPAPHGAAQTPGDLTGTWQRISALDATGAVLQPPAPVAFLILGAAGHFAHVAVPEGRAPVAKAVAEMTREELLARFLGVTAAYGTWELQGDLLTRRAIRHTDPSAETWSLVQLARMAGDTLILSLPEPGNRTESRFVRVR